MTLENSNMYIVQSRISFHFTLVFYFDLLSFLFVNVVNVTALHFAYSFVVICYYNI